jgi:hypothetical protein
MSVVRWLAFLFFSGRFDKSFNMKVFAMELQPWPGNDDIETVDTSNYFTENLSGLCYQPQDGAQPAILWAIQNYPPVIYKLKWDGATWVSFPSNGWENGKAISFTDGHGLPDAEDLTMASWDSNMIFVCSERNEHDSVSRLSVLLYMDTGVESSMNATMEWVLTADFPTVDANMGFEAITWVPDDYLVARGFLDQHLEVLYDPLNYPDHSGGLVFLGLETDGGIYAYALNINLGTYQRVASFPSGSDFIMSLSFDRDTGYLWSMCDDTCQGVHNVHSLDNSTGKFTQIASYARPISMGNFDAEGFTIASESVCDSAGQKSVFWADDKNDAGHSLRSDKLPCGSFISLSNSDDDNINFGHSWSDEQVSLVMMGVIFGAFLLLGAGILLHRHFHPPPSRPSRLEKHSSSNNKRAVGSGESGSAGSKKLASASNPMMASSSGGEDEDDGNDQL